MYPCCSARSLKLRVFGKSAGALPAVWGNYAILVWHRLRVNQLCHMPIKTARGCSIEIYSTKHLSFVGNIPLEGTNSGLKTNCFPWTAQQYLYVSAFSPGLNFDARKELLNFICCWIMMDICLLMHTYQMVKPRIQVCKDVPPCTGINYHNGPRV